ncbi:hypothetical protein VTO42DRAFT_334 [Malbranchea cinnamomea]
MASVVEPKRSQRVCLPPRSRSGCWTCRGRKVKCDERHPKCAQCTRLGYICDYNPRLSFRDDTAKVIEKMQGISDVENTVWDATSANNFPSSPGSCVSGDTLPPFSCLTTDVEREMKAEYYMPGTYYVVFRPECFSCLPEYSEDDERHSSGSSLDVDGAAAVPPKSKSPVSTNDDGRPYVITQDPNVIVMTRFEEPLTPSFIYWKTPPKPSSLRSTTSLEQDCDSSELSEHGHLGSPLNSLIQAQDVDARLLQCFQQRETFHALAQLNRYLLMHAAKLELLAARWRREDLMEACNSSTRQMRCFYQIDRAARIKEILEIQRSLKELWASSGAARIDGRVELLVSRSQVPFQKCSALFHSCLLYSYTSMWNGQCLESGGPPALEIDQHVSTILRIASEIVGTGSTDMNFLVFPIFIAGITSSSTSQKMLALDFLLNIETARSKESTGRNIRAARHVLQIAYQRQVDSYLRRGHSLDIDWIEIMVEQGLQVVSFGL